MKTSKTSEHHIRKVKAFYNHLLEYGEGEIDSKLWKWLRKNRIKYSLVKEYELIYRGVIMAHDIKTVKPKPEYKSKSFSHKVNIPEYPISKGGSVKVIYTPVGGKVK